MKIQPLKRWALGIIAAIAIAGIATYAWSYWPLAADADTPDPAVIVANDISNHGPVYAEGYAESRGNQIHYVVAGEGEPIVFLHGFPSYWFTMFGLMDEFAGDYRVIAIDGLGVGHSDGPTSVEAYKLEGLAADVEAVIDHLELGNVHLVGHDWGALVSTAIAQNNPDKVKTLTAIGALPHNIILERVSSDPAHQEIFSYVSTFKSANPPLIWFLGAKEGIWNEIYAPLQAEGHIPDAQAARLAKDIGNARRTDRFFNWYRANFPDYDTIADSDFWPRRGPRITVPSLFIYGNDDQVVTEAMVQDLADSADDMEFIGFAGVEHRPHFERKPEVVAAIQKLIASSQDEPIGPAQSEDIQNE